MLIRWQNHSPHGLLSFTKRAAARLARGLKLLLVTFIIIELSGLPALAQSLGIGYGKYKSGDFRGAETALSMAAQTKVSASEKAKIYKYLGISQFMVNKKSQAGVSFKMAASLDPRLTISPKEVLDESIVPYFNRIRVAVLKAQATKPASRSAQEGPAATTLKVSSNVQGTILIDGIIAGNTGNILNVSPGVVELTISAKGYITKRAKVRVVAERENLVEINLSKPKPKAKPQPKPRVSTRSARRAPPSVPSRRSGGLVLPDPGGVGTATEFIDPALSGRDLAGEFASDAVTGGAYAQPAYPQPGYPAQQPGYPAQPVYPPQPSYPQPAYPQPAYPQPAYPQQPYGLTPTQPYQPPPVYPQYPPQQPYYPPQPQPLPVAPQPLPPPIPIDPGPGLPPAQAEPLPPVDFFGDAGAADQPGDKAFDEDFLGDSTKKKNKRSRRKGKLRKGGKSPSAYRSSGKRRGSKSRRQRRRSASQPQTVDYVINLLPFGAGQFNNGNTILGGLFAAGQAGALYYYYTNKTQADQAITDAEAYFADPGYTEQQKQQFREDTAVYVEKKRSQQNMGMYGFVGLYAVGVGEAFWSMPTARPAKKRRRKRSRGRANQENLSPFVLAAVTDAGSDPSVDAAGDINFVVEQRIGSPAVLSFGMIPPDSDGLPINESIAKPRLGLQIDWKF